VGSGSDESLYWIFTNSNYTQISQYEDSRNYNTQTIITLSRCNKVFLLNFLQRRYYDWLTNPWRISLTNTSYRPLLYSLRMDPTENTVCIVGEACLPSRFLATEVYSCDADHLENTSTVLFTARVCWTVYRAVVWQRSDQIRYNIKCYNNAPTCCVMSVCMSVRT
jgi:hypothetical protein